ncbi:hypothetical protein LJK88_34005 [Paenibacillus sp. P26]|nr:hypothetical protein LJK88_34005 [Paenibacillus sp. P26]
MIVLNGVVIYISFNVFTFLIPFFMGSLIAVVSFWHFNLIFGKLQEKQQELAEKEAEEQAPEESAVSDDEAGRAGSGTDSERHDQPELASKAGDKLEAGGSDEEAKSSFNQEKPAKS